MNLLKKVVGKSEDNGGIIGKLFQIPPLQVKVEAKLAEGGYASIFRVRDTEKGKAYAMKLIRVQGNPEALEEVKVEARVMQQLRNHPQILRLHAVTLVGPKGGEDCLMLVDLCEHSLVDAARKGQLDRRSGMEAFRDICKAVAHMHAQNPPLSHRDLKPENLLKHPSGHWVLCDFGSATSRAQTYSGPEMYVEEDNIRKYTTPAYRAPEMWDLLCNERIDTQADIWALGCLLYWLTFAKLAFSGEYKLAVINGNYEMPSGGSQHVRQLIKDMLVVDPKNRPDITVVLARLDFMLTGQAQYQAVAPPNPNPPCAPVDAGLPAQQSQLHGNGNGNGNGNGTPGLTQQAASPSPETPQQWQQADFADFDSLAAVAAGAPAAASLSTPPPPAAQPGPAPTFAGARPSPSSSVTTPEETKEPAARTTSGGRYRLKSPSPLPLKDLTGGSPVSGASPAGPSPFSSSDNLPGAGVASSACQPHQQAFQRSGSGPHQEPIVVAPSSAQLPTSIAGSEAGSGNSTPSGTPKPPTAAPTAAVHNQQHPSPLHPQATEESLDDLRRQLTEALAANAVLQNRCSQLELMLKTQAATIAALHAAQQQPPAQTRLQGVASGTGSPAPSANSDMGMGDLSFSEMDSQGGGHATPVVNDGQPASSEQPASGTFWDGFEPSKPFPPLS